MKIAKIFIGSPTNRKGFLNNVIERIRHINSVYPETQSFLIRYYDDFFLRLLKFKFRKESRVEICEIDGIVLNCIWVKHSLVNHLLTYTFKIKGLVCDYSLHSYVNIFAKFDLISPHGLPAIYLAGLVKIKYGIPFVPTWHGSDINIEPFVNFKTKQLTIRMLELADYNFFVSKKLLEQSYKLSGFNNKIHLYSGVSTLFFKYSEIQKAQIRKKLKTELTKIVSYVGNLNNIKNVLLLPRIFSMIQQDFRHVSFFIVGDGRLEQQIKIKCQQHNLNNIYFFGKQNSNFVADLLNVTDVLLITSLNEGLPRVILEATNCGVPVVASKVGGIPEVVSHENLFELNDLFCFNVARRTTEILNGGTVSATLDEEFNWHFTLKKEVEIYKQIFNSKFKYVYSAS